jgi:hypothetical protein
MSKFKIGDKVFIVKLDDQWPSSSWDMHRIKDQNKELIITRIETIPKAGIIYRLKDNEHIVIDWAWAERWLEFADPEVIKERKASEIITKINQLWFRQKYMRERLTTL